MASSKSKQHQPPYIKYEVVRNLVKIVETVDFTESSLVLRESWVQLNEPETQIATYDSRLGMAYVYHNLWSDSQWLYL